MHQKKINKYYFTFLILLHTGLSQEYLPTLQIPLSTVRENRDFSPDLIASYANQLVFVDKKNHTIGIYSNDSLRIVGGYGSSEYSFIDPVDVIIDNLVIMILDESAGRVTKFDLNLNFIRLYNLKSNDPIYSKVFDIDSRQNIYFHSAEDGILYQRKNATQKAAKFIDYNLNSSSFCVSDIFINTDDQIGVLFDCMGELHTYGRSGRLQRKYKADLKKPVKIFFLNDDWAVINSDADIEFLNGSVRSLFIDKEVLVDAYLDRDRLLILTKTTIYIFDSSIISK